MPHARSHCGLDFGTSNSTLGIAAGNQGPRLLSLEDGKPTIPSAIFFNFETDRMDIGRKAVSEYVQGGDGRMMRALKSVLGTGLMSESVRIKRRLLPFGQIIGMFVAELKRRAETEAGRDLDHVVLGRPVQFVDGDPVADRQAQDQLENTVRAQGFHHIAFQFEPIAAALAYEREISGEELGLVIDLGGGTSDFTVIRLSPQRARAADRQADILSTDGVHIGGTDFDRMLSLARAMPELGYQTFTADDKRVLPSGPYYDLATWHRINRLYDPHMLAELRQTRREAAEPDRVSRMISILTHREGHRLASSVEDAKIALTEHEVADLDFRGEEVRLAVPITRDQFAGAINAAIDRIAETIAATLAKAAVRADAIETLILTGGSTQIPAIMARLRAMFPSARIVSTDAFGSVGLGLALDAARKFG